jgi:membrane peptidoglycan carboxypeptidase
VSSSWFAGATPKLATAVMFNKGVGNEDLEGYLVPFFGGSFPAMTFKAYMDVAINPASCGEFIKPGNIKSDKGKTYNPTPKCDDDERLNDSRTRCVERPDGDGDGDGDGGGDGDGNGNNGNGNDADGGFIDGGGTDGEGDEPPEPGTNP